MMALLKYNGGKAMKVLTQLRIEEELYDKVKDIARYEHRSANAQIEFFIARSVERYEGDEKTEG